MDTWDYEAESTPDYEEDFGPLFAKYKRDVGRSASFKAPNGENYHGVIQWVAKTWVKSRHSSRRHFYPQYIIQDDQGHMQVTLEVLFDAK